MKSSSLTPADGYVLPGCIALVSHMHAQKLDATLTLLLLATFRDDDQELQEEEVMKLLGLSDWTEAIIVMGTLARRELVTLREDRDRQACLTLTESGRLECLALFGAVMLGHLPPDDTPPPSTFHERIEA